MALHSTHWPEHWTRHLGPVNTSLKLLLSGPGSRDGTGNAQQREYCFLSALDLKNTARDTASPGWSRCSVHQQGQQPVPGTASILSLIQARQMQNKFIIWPAGTAKPWGSLSAWTSALGAVGIHGQHTRRAQEVNLLSQDTDTAQEHHPQSC